MGSFPVIVPPSPGLLCALGDLVAGFRNEFAQTLIRLTAEASDDELRAILGELEARAREWMDAQGIAAGDAARRVRRRHALPRPGLRDPGAVGAKGLEERFNACTSSSTASGCPTRRRRSSTCARSAPATGPQPELPEEEPRDGESVARAGTLRPRRPAPGRAASRGPSIVTEFDSTTVVLEGYAAEVDRYFNILIRPEAVSA